MGTRRKRHRILVVDDDIDVTELLRVYFGQQDYAVETVASLAASREAVNRALPSLVIIGTLLEDATGIDLLRQLRARPRTAHIPVMFIASVNEAAAQREVLTAGADDFIVKPFDVDIVGLRVRNAIARTERDGLIEPRTGLPTGRLLQERVQRLAEEDGWAKLEISISGFDTFRERYDFIAADEVLAFTANLLAGVLEELSTEDDFIGHRGRESFVMITRREAGPRVAEQAQARFGEEVKAFYNFMDRERGYIELDDGAGGVIPAPLMTLDVKMQQAAVE